MPQIPAKLTGIVATSAKYIAIGSSDFSPILKAVIGGEGNPAEVVAKRGIKVVNDDGALMAAIEKVCAEQSETADKVRNGHIPAAGALIGAVMKETKGQADAARVRELLLGHLGQPTS